MHGLARQFGYRIGCCDLHLFIDCGRPHIKRAAKDEGEAKHIIDLVGVIRPARCHYGIGPRVQRIGRQYFRIGIGHGKDDRLRSHIADHILRHGIGR